MTWGFLENGYCPPDPNAFRFVQAVSGQIATVAVDNQGRIFTWGDAGGNSYTGQTPVVSGANFFSHPAIDPLLEDMLHPYQVGTKSDWVKVDTSEYTFMAMDEIGQIYAWGDGYLGQGGWATNSKYKYFPADNLWKPYPGSGDGFSVALVPTLVNSDTWSDFALGWYHAIALKSDGTLWIWGTNFDNTYGDAAYADGFKSLTPIEITWGPPEFKLISAGYSVNAVVTTDDEVWCWGDFTTGNVAVPTQFPLTIPAGETIVEIKCDYDGVVVLLSGGDCYAFGSGTACIDAPTYATTTLTLIPGGHNFVAVDISVFNAGGIDAMGQMWAWGTSADSLLISRDAGFCDQDSITLPVYVGSIMLNDHVWRSFSMGGYGTSLINEDGELWMYGKNINGYVGINNSSTFNQCSVIPVDPVLLDSGASALTPATVAVGVGVATVDYIPPPIPGPIHNPCGHWHKGLVAPTIGHLFFIDEITEEQ